MIMNDVKNKKLHNSDNYNNNCNCNWVNYGNEQLMP